MQLTLIGRLNLQTAVLVLPARRTNFFGKLFKSILKIVAIVLVIIAIVYLFIAAAMASSWLATAPAWAAGAGSALGFIGLGSLTSMWAMFAVGLTALAIAAIIDPATAKEAIGNVVGVITDTVGTIVDGAGDVIAGVGENVAKVANPIFSSFASLAVWALGGFLAYKYVTRPKDPPPPPKKGDYSDAAS